MKRYLACTAALLMPLLLAAPCFAQAAGGSTPSSMASPAAGTSDHPAMAPSAGAANLSATDKLFVQKAAEGGLAEVQTAQIAQQKTQSSDIRQFAQQMIDDHTPANQKLAALAAAKGLNAPTAPNAMQQKMLARLQDLDGAKFDHAYIAGQLKAHQVMLKLFETEAKNGGDSDLRAFAQATVPVIEKHISMAQADKSSS